MAVAVSSAAGKMLRAWLATAARLVCWRARQWSQVTGGAPGERGLVCTNLCEAPGGHWICVMQSDGGL